MAGTEPGGLHWRKEIFLELRHAANFQFFLSFQKRPRGGRWQLEPTSELAALQGGTQTKHHCFFQQKICEVTTDRNFSKQIHNHNINTNPLTSVLSKDLDSCFYCKHSKISFCKSWCLGVPCVWMSFEQW